jgi:two-component system CheB/CheR fusion protein
VLGMLHFALQPKGILFLGSAETVGDLEQEFATIHRKWKIFEKNRDVRLPVSHREPLSVRGLTAPAVAPPLARVQREEMLASEAFGAFLRGDQAVCLLVTPSHELLQVFGDPRGLLHVPEGKATGEVTKMVPKELALPLNTALHKASKDEAPVAYRGMEIKQDGQSRYVDLRVTHHPSTNVAQEFFMILLQDAPASSAMSATTVQFDADSQSGQRITDLEQDLQQTKENLQATIEELETTNEEQQATNEELLASNEELQSTNEELQSVNEELYTVNSEYQKKIQELTELNNDMDNLLQSTQIGTVFLDKQLRIRKFTPAATKVINLMEHDVGRPIDHISYGINIDQEGLLGLVKSVLETDSHVERDVESRAGACLLMRIDSYRDETGQTDGVVLTFVDITERKRAQEKFRGLLEAGPDAMVIVDSDGKIVVVNAQTERLFGHDREELVGQHIDMLIPERFRAGDHEHRSGYFADLHGLRKDGTEFPVDISLTPFETEQGVLRVGAIRDVTDRKRGEEAIERANAELARKNTELEQFVRTVSHDLKSPIVTIQGFIGHLKRDAESGRADRLDSFAQHIEDAAARMRQSIDDLLELSRIGHVTMKPEITSTLDLVQRVVKDHAEEINAKHVSVEIQSDLPPVFGDPAQLIQVFDNLVANALRYGCSSDAPQIRIGASTEEGEVRLFVHDNGPGIPPQYQQRIFGLFEQLDEGGEGTGVGLAIVQRIVEFHQGRVWVESAIGEGATFWVAFPGQAAGGVSATVT